MIAPLITAKVERIHGPMDDGTIKLAFELTGREIIDVPRPRDTGSIAERIMNIDGFTIPEQKAIAKAAYEFGDRLFTMVYEAAGQSGFMPHHVSLPVKHPTVALRSEIEGLRKELEDVTARLTTAETQRDELRRLFQEPITVTGRELEGISVR